MLIGSEFKCCPYLPWISVHQSLSLHYFNSISTYSSTFLSQLNSVVSLRCTGWYQTRCFAAVEGKIRADKGRLQDCDIGDRDGRREKIRKSLKVRSAFAFNQFADDLLRLDLDLSWLLFGGIGNIRCLSGRIWLKKTSFLTEGFNKSINGIRPRERGLLTSINGRNSTFVNCLKMFQRSVGSIGETWGRYLMSHAKVGGLSNCIQRVWTCLDCTEHTFEL